MAGVHVGQSDLPAALAREICGPHAVLGLSAATAEELRAAAVRLLALAPVAARVRGVVTHAMAGLSKGLIEAARKNARRNVSVLADYARQGIPIVGTSTSCTLTLKERHLQRSRARPRSRLRVLG